MWFKTIAYWYCCDIFVSGCVQLLEWGNPLRTVCVWPMFPLFTTLCFCFRICTAVGVGESPEDSLCAANVPSVYGSLFLFQNMYSCWSGGIPWGQSVCCQCSLCLQLFILFQNMYSCWSGGIPWGQSVCGQCSLCLQLSADSHERLHTGQSRRCRSMVGLHHQASRLHSVCPLSVLLCMSSCIFVYSVLNDFSLKSSFTLFTCCTQSSVTLPSFLQVTCLVLMDSSLTLLGLLSVL